MSRAFALIICIAVAGVIAAAASRTPSPKAPRTGQFSAQAAMEDVRQIARTAHPIGTAEHDRAREYVAARFRQMGLTTEIWTGQAFEQGGSGGEIWIQGAKIQNVIATLPGKDPSQPALLVTAHYDSVANSPGAADDAAGVAAAIGIAKALTDQLTEDTSATPVTQPGWKPPERDVIFLVTDGEEAGLLGARAFFADHPLKDRIGAVLNMETRGGGGRVFMFETGPENGKLIAAFARSAVNPTATSLASFIYDHMPNDTDLTVSKKKGIAGLNYAFIGRPFDYHSATSTPANLDQGSLQHMGEQVLSVARALAYASALPAKAPNVVYADILGGPVIVYPPWTGWGVLALALGLGVLAFRRGMQLERFSALDAARGAGALVLTALIAGGFATLVRMGTGVPHSFMGERPLLARFDVYEIALALACLGAAALAFCLVSIGRPKFWSAFAGAFVLAAVLAAVLQAMAPLTGFLLGWPLLVAAGIACVLAWRWGEGWTRLAAGLFTAYAAALMLAQLLYTAHPMALGVAGDIPQVVAVLTTIAALPMFPLLWPPAGDRSVKWLGVGAVALALVLTLFIRFSDWTSPRHPMPTHVAHVADLANGRFLRATVEPTPAPWTASVLGADGGKVSSANLEPLFIEAQAAPARPVATAAPKAGLDTSVPGRLTVSIAPAGPTRLIRLNLRAKAPLKGLTIDGRPAPASTKSGAWTHIEWTAPEGLTVGMEAAPGLEARYALISDGWPADAKPLPPRPANVMPWGNSDTTVVMGALKAD